MTKTTEGGKTDVADVGRLDWDHVSGAKNPQANSVCEQTHQTIGNSLPALSALHPPAGKQQDALRLVDTAVANAVCASD
jgi:hypothetical protein